MEYGCAVDQLGGVYCKYHRDECGYDDFEWGCDYGDAVWGSSCAGGGIG